MYIYCFGGGVERKIGALVKRKHEGDMDSPHGTALGATIALVLWIVVVICAGDQAAAERVELVLPDTGVCGGAGLFDAAGASLGGSCCAVPEQVLQIGRAPASV